MSNMPYQYLTFSDLYEEEVRSTSAPSSPSLSPVFLHPSSSRASTSYHHHSTSQSQFRSQRRTRRTATAEDVHGHALLQTLTQDSDDVAQPTSSTLSSNHLDLFKVFKRRSSKKSSSTASDSSAFSTPASSRRSSFNTSHFGPGFASLHPASSASSANTSPAISRQVTKVNNTANAAASDYDALVARTARQEEEDEKKRQSELRAYFNQAAQTGLGLRRF